MRNLRESLRNNKDLEAIVIVGATASGKSSFAHKLALELDTEIISADSRAVYVGMNIGTAKPSTKEQTEIKYHMIDVLEPSESEYSLGQYLNQAKPLLKEIRSRGKLPIVVGGTGFYVDGLFEKFLIPQVKPDLVFRKSLEGIRTEILYEKLSEKRNIHPNDRFRIIRALEIQENSSEQETGRKTELRIEAEKTKDSKILKLGINFKDREVHRKRIRERTESMLESGLVNETESLLKKYGRLSLFTKTIGYNECISFLDGLIKNKDELLERIEIATRQYAKRQRIWFKRDKSIIWLESGLPMKEIDAILVDRD